MWQKRLATLKVKIKFEGQELHVTETPGHTEGKDQIWRAEVETFEL